MDYKNDFYFLPDKGAKTLFEYFLNHNRIRMVSRDTEQGKLPDIVFKHKDDYYIMELATDMIIAHRFCSCNSEVALAEQ